MIRNTFSRQELIALGFDSVGQGVEVSRDARFFAISGALGDGVRIDVFAVLTGRVVLGDQVHISPMCFLAGTGGTIELQSSAGLASHVSIYTKSDDYTSGELGAEKKRGDVMIGEQTIIGSGTKIMPGVTIAEQVSVGCNSVINQDIERGSIVISRATGLVTVASRCQND